MNDRKFLGIFINEQYLTDAPFHDIQGTIKTNTENGIQVPETAQCRRDAA